MPKLDPLIEGYLSYLTDVGRKAPRTVIDVRCTIGRVVEGMRATHSEVALWQLSLQDFLHWIERERQALPCGSGWLREHPGRTPGAKWQRRAGRS